MGVVGPESANGRYLGEADESTGVWFPVRHDRRLARDSWPSTSVCESDRPAMDGGQLGETVSSGSWLKDEGLGYRAFGRTGRVNWE